MKIKPKCDEATLKCDGYGMNACMHPVTHIDEKGYVYCTSHGEQRQAHRRCRKLRAHELQTLRSGQPIERY